MNALIKFMDTFDLKPTFEINRIYHENGRPSCCIKITVTRNDDPEYVQYHCYSIKPDGKLKYVEGNEVKGIHQGILAYLGMDREIDGYFDNKSREIAYEHLKQFI